jgi:integrase
MRTAFLLLQYTAQRPVDVLTMKWTNYSGSAIRLRQQKTRVLLDVPIDPILRDHLETLPRNRSSLTLVSYRGRPVSSASMFASGASPNPQASTRRPVTCGAPRWSTWLAGCTRAADRECLRSFD